MKDAFRSASRYSSIEKSEAFADAGSDLGWRAGEVLANLEDGGGSSGQSLEGFDRKSPVDGSLAGPEVFVFQAVIVVNVNGGDVGAQGADGLGDADCEVRMTQVQAYAYLIQVAHLKDGDEVAGGGGLADEVFNKKAHAEGTGKCTEVFEGGNGVLNGAQRPSVVAFAQVEDEVAEVDLFGAFKSALDFVHGVDPPRFLRMQKIDGWSAAATHLTVRKERGMHGKGFQGIGREPIAELGSMFSTGVVEVLAGCEDLHCFRTGACSQLEQTWVQALLE